MLTAPDHAFFLFLFLQSLDFLSVIVSLHFVVGMQ